ncbi:MAG: DUF1611 domain-containing protein [Sumerlaeia bacterium]
MSIIYDPSTDPDAGQKRRLLHLTEGCLSPRSAKTTRGVLLYSHHDSVGCVDSEAVGASTVERLGAREDIPVKATVGEFLDGSVARPDTLVVGATPVGGKLPAPMRQAVKDALKAGMDVWSGMHEFLVDDPEMVTLARETGAKIWDVRKPGKDLPVGSGACLETKCRRILAVGTDCAIGKMTAALEIRAAARKEGIHAAFVATGQTGMMIEGWGSPIDAIAGDFMAGCVERDVLRVAEDNDYVLIEGQGSLLHPGYSPVTLGLLHGCMPTDFLLCHQLGRTAISKREHIAIPSLSKMLEFYMDSVKPFGLAPRCIGVAINTWGHPEDAARSACEAAAQELGLPATDPSRFGSAGILANWG